MYYLSDVYVCMLHICKMAHLKPTFQLVHFEDGIQVVPDEWMQKYTDECWYLNYTTDKDINRAIKKREVPQDDWFSHPVKRVFGTYGK